jgi:hypothetical protein
MDSKITELGRIEVDAFSRSMATEEERFRLSMMMGAPYGSPEYSRLRDKRNDEMRMRQYESEMAENAGLTVEEWKAQKAAREMAEQKAEADREAERFEQRIAEASRNEARWAAEKAARDALVAEGRAKAAAGHEGWGWAAEAPADYVYDAMLRFARK